MTRELLKRLPADARLFSFEIDPRFIHRLRQTLPDPRLRVIAASAETIDEVVRKEGWSRGDGVVASGHDPFVCPNLSPFDSAGNARNVIFHEERIHYRDGYRAQ
jgi:16S rRNA A1518/A1519 N6-dimethyltransferase RsmA/KsgA/DIM1 with predicted DNA glycosylase/AP lyase activity